MFFPLRLLSPHQESLRFLDQATAIFRALSRVVTFFGDKVNSPVVRKVLAETHFPQATHFKAYKFEHHQVWSCVCTLRIYLG